MPTNVTSFSAHLEDLLVLLIHQTIKQAAVQIKIIATDN
jgi:hypothetical protein